MYDSIGDNLCQNYGDITQTFYIIILNNMVQTDIGDKTFFVGQGNQNET